MKCDELGKRSAENFQPENALVVVCEGLHESGFVCALLKHLNIQNCDVTFPKKKMGKDGIADVVMLLAGEASVTGIAVIRDADDDPAASFIEAAQSFVAPYDAPAQPFIVHRSRRRKSAVFLMPGSGKDGATEHLLFEAFTASHGGLSASIGTLEAAAVNMAGWSSNDKAKMRMQCAVAAYCEADPQCSLAYIWHRGPSNPVDIASPVFRELADFLKDFSS